MRKTCFRCLRLLPLDAFYAHSRMADGHLNKCKECTRTDVKEAYDFRHEARSAYERKRSKTPKRKAQMAEQQRRYRKKHPVKAAARMRVTYAKRIGALIPRPCKHCGSKDDVQAHHHDYSKPLDVEWVCFRCHREREHGQRVA